MVAFPDIEGSSSLVAVVLPASSNVSAADDDEEEEDSWCHTSKEERLAVDGNKGVHAMVARNLVD